VNVHAVLVTLTAVDVALLVAVLATYLFWVGVLLRRIADNLDHCLASVEQVERDGAVIIPGVQHINKSAGQVAGALPLLYGAAERIAAKLAPAPAPAPAASGNGSPSPVVTGDGAPAHVAVPGPTSISTGVPGPQYQPRHGRGYFDDDISTGVSGPQHEPRHGRGYLDD